MLKLKEIDDYLRRLVSDEDSDQWKPEFRAYAIREALIALVRLRPELHTSTINLSIVNRTVELGASHESFVSVLGLVDSDLSTNVCRALLPMTEKSAAQKSPCWRCEEYDEDPSGFVFNEADPYNVYLVGKPEPGQFMRVIVSEPLPPITVADLSSDTAEAPVRETYLPDIVNYALNRFRDRVDSAAGKQQHDYQRFITGVEVKLNTDTARNPSAHIGVSE